MRRFHPVRRPRPTDSAEPASVPALLRVLDSTTNSAQAQRAAIKGWLTDHTPSPPLRLSLHANGYGLLLDRLRSVGAIAHRATPSDPVHTRVDAAVG